MSDEKEESHASEIVVYKDLKSVPSWLRKYVQIALRNRAN